MPDDPIVDQLHRVARQQRKLDPSVLAENASGLLDLPRYQGSVGPARLIRDIRDAATSLQEQEVLSPKRGRSAEDPPDHSANARRLLLMDEGNTGWSHRLKEIMPSGSPAARMWYANYLLLHVAQQLIMLNLRSTDELTHEDDYAATWQSYHMRMEIDDNDHCHHITHRSLRAHIRVPDQRVVAIQNRHLVRTEPKVEALEHDQTYLGTLLEPKSTAYDWQVHIIHLGRPYNCDEIVMVRTREDYIDYREALDLLPFSAKLYAWVVPRDPPPWYIHIAVRLPLDMVQKATAEARIVERPFDNSIIRKNWPLNIRQKDGWAVCRFSKPQPGFMYGIFFPGLKLYS